MNRLTEKRNGDVIIPYYRQTMPGGREQIGINTINLLEAYGKLGELEDAFELIEEMYKKPVCWKSDDGEEYCDYYTHSTILYNPKTNEIQIYEYEFIASYKVEEYGITWWLKKEE